MGKEKCPECPPEGAPLWMVTYGDLMTLLLCFFVLLFSFSEMDVLQFESMKESFTGAFGLMDGHSPLMGKGVSNMPQKWSTKLFDNAVSKVKKAKSDKFPHDQLVFLNALERQVEVAIGMIEEAVEKEKQVAIETLEQPYQTVKEKNIQEFEEESINEVELEGLRYRQKQIDEDATVSENKKRLISIKPNPSEVNARLPLDGKDTEKNLEDKIPVEQKLARQDQFLQKKGDATRSRKRPGRNQPLTRDSGENELEDMLTGEDLTGDMRMDRVEGRGQKKRFDYPVPKKELAETRQINVSGQIRDTSSDANRAVKIIMTVPAIELFFDKSDKLKGSADGVLVQFVNRFYEADPRGYIQIESYTNSENPENYDGNFDLTARMSIAVIERILELDKRKVYSLKKPVSPSKFTAVGRGSAVFEPEKLRETWNNKNEVPREWVVFKLIRRKV
jgi:flagellar motor protein MotB